jgi:hypothetical protein
MTAERQRRALDPASEKASTESVFETPQFVNVDVTVVYPRALHRAALLGGSQPQESRLVQQRQPRH